MTKTVLITGATDGIGLETAKALAAQGHHLLLHGRNSQKLDAALEQVASINGAGPVEGYLADMSDLAQVKRLAIDISQRHKRLDVLLNNAGIFKIPNAETPQGIDVRFVVNTLAPYLLALELMPLLTSNRSRVVNLSSAAQASVDLSLLSGDKTIEDEFQLYAQSKLAITLWTQSLAKTLGEEGPIFIAVNPGSFLASKMVKQGFGMAGHDIQIGVDILIRASTSDEFANANGRYFDNDEKRFSTGHADMQNDNHINALMASLGGLISDFRR